jgi:iron(III) transport system ATP-binding protein
VSKRFGSTVALREIDLEIAAGELFFLLGPSGCGKSTLLRLIAGLTEPSNGRVFFGQRDVTELDTQRRNAVMCFQSYALWPHMTVSQNIGFGLTIRKLSAEQVRNRVAEVLKLVSLTEYADRKPNALSGGQQQRAALARALAVEPDCLLLDEPLSNLDAKLRLEMRGEIRRICKTAGFTTIYVTHDQKEALSVADRIAVMKDGRVVQVGPPAELYHKPRSSFVADFLGQTNLLPGKVTGRDGDVLHVQTALGMLIAYCDQKTGEQVILSIRPEQIRVAGRGRPASPASNRLTAKVVETTFLGDAAQYLLELNGQRFTVAHAPPLAETPPEMVVEFDWTQTIALTE